MAMTKWSDTMTNDKHILLFGGSSDVGEAIIKELPEYNIHATKHTGNIRAPVTQELSCDITNLESIDEVLKKTPSLDAIIFSAMPENLTPIQDFTGYLQAEKFLRGHVYALTQAIPKLNTKARVITISGQSADNGLPQAPYMAANFSYLHNLSNSSNAKNARKETFSMHDIQAGPINTKMWDRIPQTTTKDYLAAREESFVQTKTIAQYVRTILEADVAPTKLVVDNYYSLPK